MTKSIRTLIVDDEALARENLRIRLADFPEIELLEECASAPEALSSIRENRPELLFLDIQMPGKDGFALLEELSPEETPVVVFVTAYDEYAVRAFQIHALDYLLKPFDDERLRDTIVQVRERVALLRTGEIAGEGKAWLLSEGEDEARNPGDRKPDPDGVPRPPFLERLVVKMCGRVFFVRCDDLDWIQADGDYMRLHIGPRTHLLRRTMTELERCLDPQRFVRIHRSVIVNIDRIKELRPDTRGDHKVILTDGKEVKLTRTYRDRIESLLGDSI
jgi:two-component system LytT family response regulator